MSNLSLELKRRAAPPLSKRLSASYDTWCAIPPVMGLSNKLFYHNFKSTPHDKVKRQKGLQAHEEATPYY